MGRRNKVGRQLLINSQDAKAARIERSFEDRMTDESAVCLKSSTPDQPKEVKTRHRKKHNDGKGVSHQSLNELVKRRFDNNISNGIQKGQKRHHQGEAANYTNEKRFCKSLADGVTIYKEAPMKSKFKERYRLATFKGRNLRETHVCEEGYDNSKARHLDDDDEEDSNDEDYLGDEEDAEGIEQMQYSDQEEDCQFENNSNDTVILDEEVEEEEKEEEEEEEEEEEGVQEDEEYDEDEDESSLNTDMEMGSGQRNGSTLDFDITGYEISSNTLNSLIVEAKDDFSTATIPFSLFRFSIGLDHSVQIGLKALAWILAPISIQTFFSDIFQKRLLIIKRHTKEYYKGFFSTQDFITMVNENYLEYTTNVNIATYENGVRFSHQPKGGQVSSFKLKQDYSKGRSIQCINPQTFDKNIWYICEILQEVFSSFVGANNYLTPPNSAGFAPHWDDVDAFMLQIEGQKHWKIYLPDELHPLESSRNFTDSDFNEQEPLFDGWIEEGDLLYVPRGFIHQGKTGEDLHSHHVTISFCRNFTYANLLNKAITEYMDVVTTESTKLRTSLPPMILDTTGVVNLDYENSESKTCRRIMDIFGIVTNKLISDFHTILPSTVDSLAKEFMQNALPPLLTPFERDHCCLAKSNMFTKYDGISQKAKVRLIRKHAQRLVYETEDKLFLIHRMNNSRIFGGHQETEIDFPIEFEIAYITLMNNYPRWTKLTEIDLKRKDILRFAELLFENCLLLLKDSRSDKSKLAAVNGIHSDDNGTENKSTNRQVVRKDKLRRNDCYKSTVGLTY